MPSRLQDAISQHKQFSLSVVFGSSVPTRRDYGLHETIGRKRREDKRGVGKGGLVPSRWSLNTLIPQHNGADESVPVNITTTQNSKAFTLGCGETIEETPSRNREPMSKNRASTPENAHLICIVVYLSRTPRILLIHGGPWRHSQAPRRGVNLNYQTA